MSRLSTNLPPDKFINKLIQPGVRSVKINSVMLEKFPFKIDGLNVIFNVEGPDLGKEFQGFLIDRVKPELGRYKGQSGKIKASEWAFADGETKGGVKVSRDREILKLLQNTCTQLGITDWFQAQDEKFEKIEDLFAQFNADAPFKDKWVRICIWAKEYTNKEGYTNYDLHLPRFSMKQVPFELELVPESESRLYKFDPALNIKKKKTEIIESFGDGQPEKKVETKPDSNKNSSDFDL